MSRGAWIKRGAIVVVGALVVAAVGVGVSNVVSPDRETVVGLFPDANTLAVGNTVRAGGVEIGKVTTLGLEDGHARVGMVVDPQVLPLHEDASLRIRAVNVLGEKYVELDPGSPAAPVSDGDPPTVSMERTSVAVDVQDVIDGLGDPAATGLAALVTTAGEGLQNQGPGLAATIKGLEPAFTRTDDLARILREQNQILTQLVDRVGPVADSLAAGDGATLDRLVGNAERTLSTVAANRQALDQTLAQLPGTIVSARRTLSQLTGTADAATPTLASIRPVTDDLTDISGELRELADVADPALASLKPVLDRADQLLGQAAPLVADLRRGGPDLKSVAAGVRPLGDQLLDKNLKGVLDFVKLWSMSTNGEDGLSHYFRGVAYATPQNVGDTANGTLRPAFPSPLPIGPGVRPPGAGPTGSTDSTPPASQGGPSEPAEPGNATGLSPQQEQSMIGQLLGGQ